MSDTSNSERAQQSLNELEKELKARERKRKGGPFGIAAAAVAAILVVGGGIIFAATRDSDETVTADDAETTTETETTTEEAMDFEVLSMSRNEALPETVSCTYEETGDDANGATVPDGEDIPTTGTVNVTLETNQGTIGMELDRTVAPCTVNAIEHLVEEDYFDDTLCHRLTTDGIYVLQCGDPTGTGAGGPGFQFANEYPTDEAEDTNTPVLYPRGSIAMANAGPDTNGSQFFLNYDDSPLPPAYTYFGQISEEGLETLDAIAEAGVQGGEADGQPAEQVTITQASIS